MPREKTSSAGEKWGGRDPRTGKLVESVKPSKPTAKGTPASPESRRVIKESSSKNSDALKRLADK